MIHSINSYSRFDSSINNKNNKPAQHKNVAFGSALTKLQQEELGPVIGKMLKKLGIKENVMIIHSPSFPAEFSDQFKKVVDKGIGSSCDEGFKKFSKFCKNLFGITGIQLGPETVISKSSGYSPYSKGALSLAESLISPVKLHSDGLISEKTLDAVSIVAPKTDEGIVNVAYENAFNGKLPEMLDEAYTRFKSLGKSSPLKKEFSEYTHSPKIRPWLNRDAMYHSALSKENNSQNIFVWSDLDKKLNLYLEDKSLGKADAAKARVLELKDKYAEDIEKYKFSQFLIHRQKTEAKQIADAAGVKIFGDIKIGNGMNDAWAFPKAFHVDLDKNIFSTIGPATDKDWGVWALNPKTQEAKDFLALKMDNNFLYHNGARLDFVSGYVEPYLHTKRFMPGTENVRLADRKVYQGEGLIQTVADSIKRNKIDMNSIAAENLGSLDDVGRTKEILAAHKIPELHDGNPVFARVGNLSGNGGYSGGSGGYSGGSGGSGGYGGSFKPLTDEEFEQVRNAPVSKETIEEFGKKWFASSSHDTNTLINKTNGNREQQLKFLVEDFSGPTVVDGEGTAWKRQFSFVDPFGIAQGYNDPGTPDALKWLTKLPENYDELLYRNLAKADPVERKGYNMPEILLETAKKKGLDNEAHPLYDADEFRILKKYSKILSEEGPYTTEEAEKLAAAKVKK